MIPSPGRIVQYELTDSDVEQINRRRKDARENGIVGTTGFMLHVGNDVRAGDKFPMIITRAWGNTEGAAVNGQVMLDGNDTFWATSISYGDGPRRYKEFPRV